MSLINREALLEAYDAEHKGPPGRARELIANALAVDAVEVVRCKDCIHFCEDGYCKVLMGYCGNEDWFCAAGKRRTE